MSSNALRRFYDQMGDLFQRPVSVLLERGPAILRRCMEDPEFRACLRFSRAEGRYSRRIMIHDATHVVLGMEWPPGHVLMPHEHQGNSCFEFVVSGQQVVTDWVGKPHPSGDYLLEPLRTRLVNPNEHALIDAAITDIHSVYTPIRTRSIHVYPQNDSETFGYVLTQDDRYRRECFPLTDC